MKFLETYFKNIHDIIQQGDAREESFYSTLEKLLLAYASSATSATDIHVTVMPKKTEGGNPDFRIWDGEQHVVGYIEAKNPSVEYLDQIETTEQLQRYINTFPNLILTNFFEFRLYRNGELIDKVLAAKHFVSDQLKSVPTVDKPKKLLELFEKFFSFSLPKTYTAESLAVELAKRTRFLRDEVVAHELEDKGNIFGFYDAFRKFLLSRLTKDEFADLYAQTIVYGLFAARTRSDHNFTRKSAFDRIPRTIGILRDIFRYVSLEETSLQMSLIIDDISEVLAITDVKQILRRYYHEGKGTDPIVHFYETFLSEYDPEERERRGVYYTPEPVVSYIVKSLNLLLKEKFGKVDGLASEDVTLLDPAAGTMTFVAQACQSAVKEFVEKYGSGDKHGFIKDHILENFYAFELMMAPYAVGHLKMSFFLEELGYELQKDERFKLYLTNTLNMKDLEQTKIPGIASLAEESRKAGDVKKDKPILVILGNPPYSVSSVNKSDFIEREMDLYKQAVRDERNIQPLSDDYIKFIRFAHWKIEESEKGVIGMITNNSYLSGLIHRGMREELLKSFDEIYVLNLHGNARIGETTPDGSKDENVFDIMQGVSIVLFVKTTQDEKPAKVFYKDLYGLRQKKRDYLNDNDVKTTDWLELDRTEPYYFFVPKDFSLQDKYDQFVSVTEIFREYSSGVKTHRDHFVVGFNKDEIAQKVRIFTGNLPDDLVARSLGLKDTRDWNLKEVRKEVKKRGDWRDKILPYSYRPFDIRKICYHLELIEKGTNRFNIMRHFFQDNLGLVTTRSRSKAVGFSHIFISNFIADIHYSGGQTYVLPLYLYPDTDKKDLFSELPESQEREPNLNREFVKALSYTYGKEPTPEEIFYYIYGVLYSNTYRQKYAEFLKIDFPRVPFTKDYELFSMTAGYGKKLVDLHLLKSDELTPPIARFQGQGNNRVAKSKRIGRNYKPEEKRVYINKDKQYFEGIEPDVWEYQIGGYQVCDKWLKDRKERELSNEELKHYCRVVTALYKTIQIQKKIDARYLDVERKIIKIP